MKTSTFPTIISRKLSLLGLLLIFLAVAPLAFAQEEPALRLSLRRDFGTGIGSNIQGTFSLRAEGPEDLERVEFLLDGEVIGQATAAPFRYQFHTESFPPGTHTFSAIGYTAVGQTLTSNSFSSNFLTSSQSSRAIFWLVVPLLILALGGRWLTNRIAGRGGRTAEKTAVDGLFGGTICPKCKRPFARHWWGINIGVGKYDRCPHCGKWSVVQRVHPDILAASVQAMKQADAQSETNPPSPADDDDGALRRRLDDSRYDS